MKKLTILLFGLFLAIGLNAQEIGDKFTQQKKAKNYVWQPGDRYNPTVAGVCSFFIPGLGQTVVGEPGRGAIFFVAYTASSVVSISYLLKAAPLKLDAFNDTGKEEMVFARVFAATSVGIWIWSIADASKCAKVNNLYFRDKYQVSIGPNEYGLGLKIIF